MKILYLITRAELGGAQVHVGDLIASMKDRAQIVVASGETGYLTDRCKEHGVPFRVVRHLIQPVQPVTDLRCIAELVRLIRAEKPDVIHLHTSKAGLLGRIAAAITQTPCIFTAHTWSCAEGTGILRQLIAVPCEWIAGHLPCRIIAVSESNRLRALQYGFSVPSRLTTVWNGVPDSPHRASPGRGGVPRLIMVARFAPQKDHLTLLRALASIEEPFRLTLVGDGPTRADMERETAQLGLTPKVEFLGTRHDIGELLADSDAFVLCTNWEGFPLTIIEAMRAGLPVIATDVDGVEEAVIDGKTGFLTKRHEDSVLRGYLRLILQSSHLRKTTGAAGRRRYEEAFTLETMVRKTWAVYQDVLGGAGSSALQEIQPLGVESIK